MTSRGFTVEFSPDLAQCRVVDEKGVKLLQVAIAGEVPLERRDRIARLIGDLIAECQGGMVVVAPFLGDVPS